MSNVARLSDICTGHFWHMSRSNISASENVFVNGLGAHRQSDGWAIHGFLLPHASILASGSSTVFVNGLQLGRVGDPIVCGSIVATGSDNVFAGG